MNAVGIDGMARHAAYVYYENSSWAAVTTFLEEIDFTEKEAKAFIKSNRSLILKYRDELVDWFEKPLKESLGK